MSWESESLKALAQRAAAFSGSQADLSTLRSLYLTGLFDQDEGQNRGPDVVRSVDPTKVGIWQRDPHSLDFVRRADRRREWGDWADKKTIGRKTAKWRIALIGESVARGYLYDPDYTPAAVLETKLKQFFGSSAVDVVDLAKSNLSIYEIERLARQSVAIAPDIVVIFAGNNWRNHLEQKDIPYAYALLRDGGVPALAEFLNGKTKTRAERVIENINECFARVNIPVIWVVPEFNLQDWADPASNAPLLPAKKNAEWSSLRSRLVSIISECNWSEANALAERMREIDGDTNATAPRALAFIAKMRGDFASRRRYLEICRDSEGWDPSFAYSPRATNSVQTAIRSIGRGANRRVVDIPDLLGSRLNGDIPGRRMFLDYCHLTSEAIDLSMSAIAAQVVSLISGETADTNRFSSSAIDSKVQGRASLLAAVHNAHFFQSYDVVHYWCANALEHWPSAAEIMKWIVDFQSRRVPLMACKSVLDLFALNEPVTLRYLMRSRQQRLDLVLSRAIVNSLKEADSLLDCEVDRTRLEEHSVANGPKDLTSFYYLSGIPDSTEPRWTSGSFPTNRGSRAMFVAALWPATKFIFFSDCSSVNLKFTYRIPNKTRTSGSLFLKINGTRIAEMTATSEWRTVRVTVPEHLLAVGMNEVVLEWPDCDEDGTQALSDAAEILLKRRLPGFYPVFGQLHDFWAFTGADKDSNATPKISEVTVVT